MDCKNNEICERCKEKNSLITDYENGIIVCNNCVKVYEERIISDENEKRTLEGEDGDNQIQSEGPSRNQGNGTQSVLIASCTGTSPGKIQCRHLSNFFYTQCAYLAFFQDVSQCRAQLGLFEFRIPKPQFGNEFGTTLVIRDHGKIIIIKVILNITKIQRTFARIQSLLSSKFVHQKFIEETKSLYETISKNKNMQGRNLNEIILGIYYYVCRKTQIIKTFKQISLMFSIKERNIKKAFNSIKSDIVSPSEKGGELNEIKKNLIRNI